MECYVIEVVMTKLISNECEKRREEVVRDLVLDNEKDYNEAFKVFNGIRIDFQSIDELERE